MTTSGKRMQTQGKYINRKKAAKIQRLSAYI